MLGAVYLVMCVMLLSLFPCDVRYIKSGQQIRKDCQYGSTAYLRQVHVQLEDLMLSGMFMPESCINA